MIITFYSSFRVFYRDVPRVTAKYNVVKQTHRVGTIYPLIHINPIYLVNNTRVGPNSK